MILHVSALVNIMLISLRLGMVLMFSPLQVIKIMPMHARFFLVIGFSLFLSFLIPYSTTTDVLSSAICELINGLMLLLCVMAVFSIVSIAGQLMDNQLGINVSSLFNPSINSHDSITGRLLGMLLVLVFFSSNGHHRLFEGVYASFQYIPPGHLFLLSNTQSLFHLFGWMIFMGLAMAMPIIVFLMILELSAAFLTRHMPQMNTYFVILPLKIMLGILMLIGLLSGFQSMAERWFDMLFLQWQGFLS